MSTAKPDAATRAPAHAPRASVEEPVAEESLQHHAKRFLLSRLSAMACGVLDPCIALLQRLRQRAGGAQAADEEGEDGPRSKNARPGGGRDAAARPNEGEGEDDAEAPRQKSRLLSFLIYFSVFLAGGVGGGALAYQLLAKQLDRQATESRRLEAEMSERLKSVAPHEKKLEEAQTTGLEAEKKFEEAQAKRVEAEKKFEEAQAKRIEAEKKLEASLNDSRAAAQKQRKLDEAVRLLEQIRGADRSSKVPRSPSVDSKGSAEPDPRTPNAGNCTVAAGNVNALKDCVEKFNR